MAPPVERALLVGAPRKGSADARDVDEHLDELARLVDTAGAAVAGRVVQHITAPTPDLFIGRGKAEEIGRQVRDIGASVVVFDEELSPRQGKNLEEALGMRVMDRTEVILDIFALRARSREAKMQVELAQLETDRRMIRAKIGALKKKLAEVADHRARLRGRTRERDVLRVALVGYTNAGKSSLLRALTGAEAHVEDRLFATLDTASRETVVDGRKVRFTDTVGFIRKLPHDLVASFRATLEEAADADVIVHVVDVSHPAWDLQAEVVGEVLHGLGPDGTGPRVVMALNKADRLASNDLAAHLREAAGRGWEAAATSAVTPGGVRGLRVLLGHGAQPQTGV